MAGKRNFLIPYIGLGLRADCLINQELGSYQSVSDNDSFTRLTLRSRIMDYSGDGGNNSTSRPMDTDLVMVSSGLPSATNYSTKETTLPDCEHVCHPDVDHDSFISSSCLPTSGIPEPLLQAQSIFPPAILPCLSPFTLTNSYLELNAEPLNDKRRVSIPKRSMTIDTVTCIPPMDHKTPPEIISSNRMLFAASNRMLPASFYSIVDLMPSVVRKTIASNRIFSAASTRIGTNNASRQLQLLLPVSSTSQARGALLSSTSFLSLSHLSKAAVPQDSCWSNKGCNLLSLNSQAMRSGQTSSNSALQAVHSSIPSCCLPTAAVHRITDLQVMYLLLAAGEASAANRNVDAKQILACLRNHFLDTSSLQKFAAQYCEAFDARLNNERKGVYGLSFREEEIDSYTTDYEDSPLGDFSLFTCNQTLLEALELDKTLHILDLHVEYGLQWPAFFLMLAKQMSKPPKVRLSILGSNPSEMANFGAYLYQCAKSLSLPFEFCPILTRLENFSNNMVKIYVDEVFAISSCANFHGLLNEEPSGLDTLLNDLKQLKPKVMVFAENDGNLNSGAFSERFRECMNYCPATYAPSKVLASSDSPTLVNKEPNYGSQRIQEIILSKGPARVKGFEDMMYWYKRMEAAHFRCIPLSLKSICTAHNVVRPHYRREFTVKNEESGYLTLGWNDEPLISVSAWY